MPRATVGQDTKRVELKTLEGGFVVIRKFDYGETLHRRNFAMRFKAPVDKQGRPKADESYAAPAYDELQHFEFATAILDHNLEDETGRKLDFRNPKDFNRLDTRIAIEIERALDEFNGGIEDMGPFEETSTPTTPTTDTSQSQET